MKIGFDAKRAFQNTRGLGNYSRNLIYGLVDYYPENEYYLFGQPAGNGECTNWFRSLSDQVHLITPDAASAIKKALWRSFSMGRYIEENQLDIYHGLSHEIPVRKKNKLTKYVVTIHDLLFLRFKENFKWLDVQIYLSKIKYSCRNTDLILAVSRQTKEDLINYLKVPEEKIIVCYQSCSPLYYNLLEETQKTKIRTKYKLPADFFLFVGALVEHKNIERIIEAMAILPKEIKLPLIIVGRTTRYKEKLLEKIKKLNLVKRIIFLDYVDHEDMPALYQLAKIMIWPSLFEGFGIPIIEALFSGLPVITSKGGCFPEAGGPSTCYIDPLQPEEIAAAVQKIVTDEALYLKMKHNGYEYVSRFNLSNTTNDLMNIYSSI